MLYYSENIYFPNQVKRAGYLEVEGGVFTAFYPMVPEGAEFVDYAKLNLIPGFIDQHIHGWGTGSFNADPSGEAVRRMKEQLPSVGCTSFLATSGTEKLPHILEQIRTTTALMDTQEPGAGAECLGLHLEGPFINPKQKGMMDEKNCQLPSIEIVQEFLDAQTAPNRIRLMTMAPELEGAKEVIQFCHANGIQLNIGHSDATFEVIKELKEYGLGGVTHMYSGMRGLHHRELGVAGSARYFDDLKCEFAKQTGWTVKPEAFQIVYRLKGPDNIIMSTDCGALAMSNKTHYHYTRKQTFIPQGDHMLIRDDDGTEQIIDRTNYENVKDLELGFIYSMQNLAKNVHPSMHEIVKLSSENCAKYIGVADRKGAIEVGKDADFLVLDNDLNLHATYCMGKLCYEA